jgi:hypothetical protein
VAISNLRLPEIGQHVGIRADTGSARVCARVLHASDERLSLIFDGRDGYELLLAPGFVLIEWATPCGLTRTQGRVPSRVGRREPFVIELAGETDVLQRRSYVRVRATLPIALMRPDSDCGCDGLSVDVGGGGVRINFLQMAPAIGDELELKIWLGDGTAIPALASVVLALRQRTYAFAFEKIRPAHRERLIQFVFNRLRQIAQSERWDCWDQN